MASYGVQTIDTIGGQIAVSADGCTDDNRPAGGITIDWSTVTAVGSDTTLIDGTVIKSGQKYLRYGQVLCRITTAEVQTITVTGSPTGGTFTLKATGTTTETATIAYNAAAATVQTVIRALGGDYAEVAVTGSAGGPFTVTFPYTAGNALQLVLGTNALTGGTTPSVTGATTTAGTDAAGKYGPYDSGASDGRQTVSRNACWIVNTTVVESTPGIATDFPDVINGGLAFKERILMGVSGHPSVSSVESALPTLMYPES